MPDLSLEQAQGARVAGIDEAGRGPLAGSVVAAAVILPPGFPQDVLLAVNDSKLLGPARRESLFALIRQHAHSAIASADVTEIDTMNILQATLLAMQRAVAQLPVTPDAVLVDGNRCPPLPVPATAIIGGDRRSASIAAASILAKVHRDRLMQALDRDYPQYGWARNAGYGTPAHLEALACHGASIHHRRTFAPVRRVLGLAA